MYSLKVCGRVISTNNRFDLFEKRIDLTQNLQNPGNHTLISQIKSNEINMNTNKSIQISFKVLNT